MLSRPDSPRGNLLSQYVCARITQMDNVDLGLFEYDRHNTLYYFALNADEQIYLRYGGRDSRAVESYLNLESLERALEIGLDLHRRYQAGELEKTERPAPVFARDFPLLVERTIGRGACVECHLIADYRNLHRERDGTLDKATNMYRSPDLRTIGIHLDVPKGLVVEGAEGAVAEAGMEAGDLITHLNGKRVWTFGDFQYLYDKVDREAEQVSITVARDGRPIELTVALPVRWWLTDLTFRQWSIEPRIYFESRPLTEAEKQELGLDPRGFASEVVRSDSMASLLGTHQLQKGDVIAAVNGVESDPMANTADLFLKLRVTAGDTATLSVIRGGERIEMPLKTVRLNFRK